MLRIENNHFLDEYNRVVKFRGVNLAGSSKLPTKPFLPTYISDNFFQHQKVSFVGRPFPLKEADTHFQRLKDWGFNFIRLLTTWEAIEHEGPGIYDEEYLEYLTQIVKKAQEYGIWVFIDPHQDVWSRFSGGDGAPGWTFEVAGLDITQFQAVGAAIVHNTYGDPFPEMTWPTNYAKLATATMFTLFFGGNDFAPETKYQGQSVQDFLQEHFIKAIQQVAKRLKGFDNVLGYEVMNEPSKGWIGHPDLNQYSFLVKKGASPTPFQAMAMGAGHPMFVEDSKLATANTKSSKQVEVNPRAIKAWLSGHSCIWKAHGIWENQADGNPILKKPNYFAEVNGKAVNFGKDYYKPFVLKFAKAIREEHSGAFIFVESVLEEELPQFSASEAKDFVFAPHWYDVKTLLKKSFNSFYSFDVKENKLLLGKKKVQRVFTRQFQMLKEEGKERLPNAPIVIGEVGIPFDMNKQKALKTNDYQIPIKALDTSIRAMENNQLNYCLWNYTPDNTYERGDQWNGEDLSIFSKDFLKQDVDLKYRGGRALKAAIRPFAYKIAGVHTHTFFDYKKGIYELHFVHAESIVEPTEIFIPSYHFADNYKVEISDGTFEMFPEEQKLLYFHTSEANEHRIKVIAQGAS